MKTSRKIKINADINTIWSYVAEPENQKKWINGILEIKTEANNELIFVGKQGSIKGKVLETTKPSKYVLFLTSELFDVTQTYTLEQHNPETVLLKYATDTNVKNLFFKIVGYILAYIFPNTFIKKQLLRLKECCEKQL